MENSRIAGARRRLAVAKRLTAAVAAVAFGVTFVAIRSGGVAGSSSAASTADTTTTQTQAQTQTTTQSQQSFFGNSSVGSSSGAAPSVSSSTS